MKRLRRQGERGLSLPGVLTATSWQLPANLTLEQWADCGHALDKIESGSAWWRGDWWIAGHKYGERMKAALDSDLSFGRWMNCGSVCREFETSRRREVLTFYHHEIVASLPKRQQEKWLDRAEAENWSASKLLTMLRHAAALARTEQIDLDAAALGKFVVLYADPPWRYEHPPMGGSNRSIENQYPTMALEEICTLPISEIAHENAVLFLWATNPKLRECMNVLDAWGFGDACYRTNMVWTKDDIGMGYYFREQHELLLVAKRGELPAPPVEARRSSVLNAPRMEHSAKPAAVYDIIDSMYPGVRKIELFSRSKVERPLWTTWGNQARAANPEQLLISARNPTGSNGSFDAITGPTTSASSTAKTPDSSLLE
jgi:N6-adenosine-specific RNA methylase IME4